MTRGDTDKIEVALVAKWKQMGGWPGVESGMVNMTGALADVTLAFVAEERERCAKLLEEGYERDVATPYRNDGVRSKNDQCIHGRYMYEDCEACAAIAIRRGP